MTPSGISHALSAREVLQTLERWAPFARPYNFDDRYDCWGFLRQVFRTLPYAVDIEGRLDGPDEDWAPIADPDDLVIGDLLVSHASHPGDGGGFHTVVYCGRVGDEHLVYDSSPRGAVPLFVAQGGGGSSKAGRSPAPHDWHLTGDRPLHSRHLRATESTDRLRRDGGAYLRLWNPGMRFFDRGIHAALLRGGGERDLLATRLAAGLSALPFYTVVRLSRGWTGDEEYDNRLTRFACSYCPDGAPVPDDAYLLVIAGGDTAPLAMRPGEPTIVAPSGQAFDDDVEVRWEPPPAALGGGSCGAVDAWLLELWKEEPGPWKHLVWQSRFAGHSRGCALGGHKLDDDTKYVIHLFAHRVHGGWSTDATATFLFRPHPDSPFLAENTVLPLALEPDGFDVVPTPAPTLRWRFPGPVPGQRAWRLQIFEGGPLGSGAPCVHEAGADGGAAAETAYAVPAAASLRVGHTYRWYLTTCDAEGRWGYAPREGVFIVGASGGGV